ncbi:MAG: hypothetical protein ACI9XO_003204 [Paraglaciecola sp.]|jgi:hypothetical protein
MASLKLGIADDGNQPQNVKKYLESIHATLDSALQNKAQFRDESQWRSMRTIPGNSIKEFQQFLMDAGFLLPETPDGIYGYRTRAGARLFQEYVRSVEGLEAIGAPDGVVGPNTRKHIKRWKDAGQVSDWGKSSVENQSIEFSRWMDILRDMHEGLKKQSNPILDMVNTYSEKSDTLLIEEWSFNDEDIHFIGIRRNYDIKESKRGNDDIFILLINGMVFKFWGSCDPNPESSRADEPYLVEGQHLYKLGWHKMSNRNKAYMALKPLTVGPLVYRDRTGADALTEANVKAGLTGPNNTINIHWSGIGSSNFSAGCQVIAGASYINHKDEVIDCSKFASPSYAGMKKKAGVPRKTKGAYNLLADLVAVYRPKEQNTIRYTLGRDSNLNMTADFDMKYAETLLNRMQGK